MKLSVVMIVKNEEPVIRAVLQSVSWFDEVVVVDTGSTDRTMEIAQQFPNVKLYTCVWDDDFAAARNHALLEATGDWCMQIDADHVLDTEEERFRQIVGDLDHVGCQVASIELVHIDTNQMHHGAWLWKRSPNIFYQGRIHEVLSQTASAVTLIRQYYGKSPSHDLDPDRNIRILHKEADTPRTRFYLGRELYERGKYIEAITALKNYLSVATWLPEICEANLTLARCYWQTSQGDLARETAIETIRNNPMFKEALLFLAEVHYEPWKGKWRKLAEAANNTDVLFVREM